MPLLLFRSAMVLRLWLALAALLASFFLRSWVVSRLCPWPRGLPVTAVEFSGRYLREYHPPHNEGNVLEGNVGSDWETPQPTLMASTKDTPWPGLDRKGNGTQPQA